MPPRRCRQQPAILGAPLFSLLLAIASCGTRDRLVGTWQHDASRGDGKSWRRLTLLDDGKFGYELSSSGTCQFGEGKVTFSGNGTWHVTEGDPDQLVLLFEAGQGPLKAGDVMKETIVEVGSDSIVLKKGSTFVIECDITENDLRYARRK